MRGFKRKPARREVYPLWRARAAQAVVKTGGFTLLEVLVAIGVFSVVAMVSYTTLDTYLDQRERLTVHYGKLERLQRLFILLERDIQFATRRSVRVDGDTEPAIVGEEGSSLLTLTVAQPDVTSATGVSLKRVQWRREGEQLIREQWDMLDRSGRSNPAELLVSDEVTDIALEFWVYSRGSDVDTRSSLEVDEFPSGIEVSVTLDSGVQYRRLYAVAQGG